MSKLTKNLIIGKKEINNKHVTFFSEKFQIIKKILETKFRRIFEHKVKDLGVWKD